MARIVPHHSVAALAIGPGVWLAYFVLTYLVADIGCGRGWTEEAFAGLAWLTVMLWTIAILGFGLIAYASWESLQNLRAARSPKQQLEEEERDRQVFLARAGLFLCGISLLGVLWGAINIVVFDQCAS